MTPKLYAFPNVNEEIGGRIYRYQEIRNGYNNLDNGWQSTLRHLEEQLKIENLILQSIRFKLNNWSYTHHSRIIYWNTFV